MKSSIKSTHWLAVQLGLIATGVAFILYVALPLPGSKLLGGFLLTIGLLHVLFYKTSGRKMFAITQSSRPLIARFWTWNGERGTQLLFLGIGIILAIAGCSLLILGGA